MSDRGELLYQVLGYVRPITLDSARAVEQLWRPHGVTVGMRAVLDVLASAGPMTVPGVATLLDLARQGVQRLVNELMAEGFVESQPNPRHRRSALIVLTTRGEEMAARIRRTELERLAEMVDECSEEEIAIATRVLAGLARDIHAQLDPPSGGGDQ